MNNMIRSKKRKLSDSTIYKHNLKVMKQYNTLYPDDIFFKSLPKSCLYTKNTDSEADSNNDDLPSTSASNMDVNIRAESDVPIAKIITPQFSHSSDNDSNADIDLQRRQPADKLSSYKCHEGFEVRVAIDEELQSGTCEENDEQRECDGHDTRGGYTSNTNNVDEVAVCEVTNSRGTNNNVGRTFLQTCILDIPLIPKSQCTAKDHLLSILAISVKNNWTWEATLNVFQWINASYGLQCLPTTKKTLWAALGRDNDIITRHVYCKECMTYLGKGSKPLHQCNCNACGPRKENLCLNYFLTLNLRTQIADLLAKPSIAKSLQYRFTRIKRDPEAIEDIYDGQEYQRLCMPGNFLSNPNNFSFTFNTDGCSVSTSSTTSAWPIYVQINELPPHLRKKHTLLAGIFVDDKHPVMNTFLENFVDQIQDLNQQGINWKPTATTEITSKFMVIVASVDSIARPAILRMKQFNGEYGCSMCYAKGEHFQGKRVYPVSHSFGNLRSDAEIRADMNKANETNRVVNGVKGPSSLMILPEFDLATGPIVEGMHSGHLGVAKQHSELIVQSTSSKARYYVGRPTLKKIINRRLLYIRPHSRRSRLPRSLESLKKWKASELSNWLDYSPVCLQGILPKKYLAHFCQLAEAMHILNGDSIKPIQLNKAKRLLKSYVKLFEKYYGKENMSFNIHLLTHITETVQNWGPIWAHSAYSFESWNRKIMSKITSPYSRCTQICDRFLLSKYIENLVTDESVSLTTKKTVSKLMKIPLEIGNSIKQFVGRGPCQERGPNGIEKRALLTKGYDPNTIRCFSQTSINGVLYKCDTGKTKFCNSIAYCEEFGFGDIVNFVYFRFQDVTIHGVFIKRLKEQRSSLKISYIKRVKRSNDVFFIEAEKIVGPALTIQISANLLYALKLPNYWETD